MPVSWWVEVVGDVHTVHASAAGITATLVLTGDPAELRALSATPEKRRRFMLLLTTLVGQQLGVKLVKATDEAQRATRH